METSRIYLVAHNVDGNSFGYGIHRYIRIAINPFERRLNGNIRNHTTPKTKLSQLLVNLMGEDVFGIFKRYGFIVQHQFQLALTGSENMPFQIKMGFSNIQSGWQNLNKILVFTYVQVRI